MRRLGTAVTAVTVVAGVLLAGCGLPTPGGVQSGGRLADEQQQDQPQQIITRPAGPKANGSPSDIVSGFLTAQGSPEDGFAVARSFLTGTASDTWDPEAGVRVFGPDDPAPTPSGDVGPEAQTATVTVSVTVTAKVRADGSAVVAGGVRDVLTYGVVKADQGWRLADVPKGLTVSQSRQGVLAPYAVMMLSPSRVPRVHLVPDLVRLPATGDDLVSRLVQAVLDGPSQALGASAVTAAPAGTKRLQARSLPGGEVLVDL